MNGENDIVSTAVNRLAEFQNEQPLITTANSTPLPGALRNAFKINPDIKVGNYSVRPIVDRDLEFLQFLDNPLHRHFEAQRENIAGEIMRGRPAWELCYMFTHPFKEVKALFVSSGPLGVKQAAENEFEQFDLASLMSIVVAVMQQMDVFWEPVIAHQVSEGEGDSKKNTLADGTDKAVTDLDSSSKSVVS